MGIINTITNSIFGPEVIDIVPALANLAGTMLQNQELRFRADLPPAIACKSDFENQVDFWKPIKNFGCGLIDDLALGITENMLIPAMKDSTSTASDVSQAFDSSSKYGIQNGGKKSKTNKKKSKTNKKKSKTNKKKSKTNRKKSKTNRKNLKTNKKKFKI